MHLSTLLRFLFLALLALTTAVPAVANEPAGTVLITGANRGIGLALAERFGEAGYRVIGTARRPDGADALRESGARVEQLDVTSSESVGALAERLAGVSIDILVNNAGIKGHDADRLADLDVDELAHTLDVNTLGPLRVIQAMWPNLEAGEKRLVANVSSMMGSMELNTWGCCLGYRASKSAINSFTKTLAVDYGEDGWVFVTLHPGYVQTDMNDGKGNITPRQSADGLFRVITGLETSDNGRYFDFQGKELPW
jgi:NAD(P)-dependent dehydrogenase (short-subunit alcohol dehydrogenase family)